MVPCYYYDVDGYFAYKGMAQKTSDGVLAMPVDATLKAPEFDGLHFAKWNAETEEWEYEAKPTKVEDFVNVKVSHVSQTPHFCELRAILQLLVETTEGWRIVRGSEEEGLWWSAEKIPEPTELEKAQAEISELKGKLAATDYVVTKIAEGVATSEEYSTVLSDRQAWRARINVLESRVQELQAAPLPNIK